MAGHQRERGDGAPQPGARPTPSRVTTAVLALLLGGALSAVAQTGGGSSSMPGTAGVNPGAVSKETAGDIKNRDTSTAGTAYPGNSPTTTTNNPLGVNPLSTGTPNPTGGAGSSTRTDGSDERRSR
jgi:hypothetical protein